MSLALYVAMSLFPKTAEKFHLHAPIGALVGIGNGFYHKLFMMSISIHECWYVYAMVSLLLH